MTGVAKNQQKRDAEMELIRRVAKQTRKAVVTGPAAARLMGLNTYGWVEKVDLVLPSKTRATDTQHKEGDRIYRSAQLPASNWSDSGEIRTVSLIRALFDSYRYYGRREALVQIEAARRKWPTLTVDNLLGRTGTLPRAKGLRAFRQLISYSGDLSFSPLETLKRDAILRAIEQGRLAGVETIEYQVGFSIRDTDARFRKVWVDILINGFIAVEADGLVKKDGTFGDALDVTVAERQREIALQNQGVVFIRTGWHDPEAEFIQSLQTQISLHPGVKSLPNRIAETYREFLDRMDKEAPGES